MSKPQSMPKLMQCGCVQTTVGTWTQGHTVRFVTNLHTAAHPIRLSEAKMLMSYEHFHAYASRKTRRNFFYVFCN